MIVALTFEIPPVSHTARTRHTVPSPSTQAHRFTPTHVHLVLDHSFHSTALGFLVVLFVSEYVVQLAQPLALCIFGWLRYRLTPRNTDHNGSKQAYHILSVSGDAVCIEFGPSAQGKEAVE